MQIEIILISILQLTLKHTLFISSFPAFALNLPDMKIPHQERFSSTLRRHVPRFEETRAQIKRTDSYEDSSENEEEVKRSFCEMPTLMQFLLSLFVFAITLFSVFGVLFSPLGSAGKCKIRHQKEKVF